MITKIKFIKTLILICILTLGVSCTFAYGAYRAPSLVIEGKAVNFNSNTGYPYVDTNFRTMVPLRQALETYGCSVAWDPKIGCIAKKDGTVVTQQLGRKYLVRNNTEIIKNDTIAVAYKGRIYVPIRAVLEAFGAHVSYDQKLNQVNISSKPISPSDPSTKPKPVTPGDPNPSKIDIHRQHQLKIISLVNIERSKYGLAPLREAQKLVYPAGIRAKELSVKFSHQRPGGGNILDIILNLGYYGAGENIAMGQGSPEAVMSAWMKSKGHRANILNAGYTSIGVGHYSAKGTDFWVQLFAK